MRTTRLVIAFREAYSHCLVTITVLRGKKALSAIGAASQQQRTLYSPLSLPCLKLNSLEESAGQVLAATLCALIFEATKCISCDLIVLVPIQLLSKTKEVEARFHIPQYLHLAFLYIHRQGYSLV